MHLMFFIDAEGKRVYTLKAPRFSPDDKFSSQRLACKKRFNLLPTQGPKAQF
ncbi:hypothetical protein T492DRAFT_865515 [Pavlovales sp. CCMP2436]|nr:hypothetical protein T492DRAFT_865515 [Pavlovales sp. CCMP2436]